MNLEATTGGGHTPCFVPISPEVFGAHHNRFEEGGFEHHKAGVVTPSDKGETRCHIRPADLLGCEVGDRSMFGIRSESVFKTRTANRWGRDFKSPHRRSYSPIPRIENGKRKTLDLARRVQKCDFATHILSRICGLSHVE